VSLEEQMRHPPIVSAHALFARLLLHIYAANALQGQSPEAALPHFETCPNKKGDEQSSPFQKLKRPVKGSFTAY
jgi:hypothetical protein